MFRRRIIVCLCIVTSIIAIFIWISNSNNYALRIGDMTNQKFKYQKLFESSPGFGNDAYNIYTFSLINPDIKRDFKNIDEKVRQILEYDYFQMLSLEDDYEDLGIEKKDIEDEIRTLVNKKDTKYYFFSVPSEKKELWIYNSKLNIGYYLIIIY